MSQKIIIKCAYFNCEKLASNDEGLKLYRFPKDQKTYKQWVYNTNKLVNA